MKNLRDAIGDATNLHFSKPNLTLSTWTIFVWNKVNERPPNKQKMSNNEIELFESALKRFLFRQSFYSTEEYSNYNST